MKITLKTATYITDKIKEIERVNKRLEIERIRNSNEIFEKKEKLAEYVSKLTNNEWLELKKQFERPQAY